MNANSFPGPRGFARYMLDGDRLLIRPQLDSISIFGGYAIEVILFREACWQVELITMLPGVVVPKHRHNRVDSCDLMIGGTPGCVEIGERAISPLRRGSLAANLVRVGKGVWHHGKSGKSGAVYLSFQKWDGEPGLISEDWEAW